MEEVTARVYLNLVSISRSRYSAVYVGGHAKTALLQPAISAAAHQMCEMLMNVQFRLCRDERSELRGLKTREGPPSPHGAPSRGSAVLREFFLICDKTI
jgi:hypothetical protein